MSSQRILVIDNYDSFTFNLVQYIGSLGAEPLVYRNDQIDADRISDLNPDKIVISPGPGLPADAGCTEAVIEAFHNKLPIFGICLGHQAIAEVLGGKVVRAGRLVHGKTSAVEHNGDPLFKGIGSPFTATRYHSLTVERHSLPTAINVTAWTEAGTIMALRVAGSQTVGVQFHPESYLTADGMKIMENFLCFTN